MPERVWTMVVYQVPFAAAGRAFQRLAALRRLTNDGILVKGVLDLGVSRYADACESIT